MEIFDPSLDDGNVGCKSLKKQLKFNNDKKKISEIMRSKMKYYNGYKYQNNTQNKNSKILTVLIQPSKVNRLIGTKGRLFKWHRRIRNTNCKLRISKSCRRSTYKTVEILKTKMKPYALYAINQLLIEKLLIQIENSRPFKSVIQNNNKNMRFNHVNVNIQLNMRRTFPLELFIKETKKTNKINKINKKKKSANEDVNNQSHMRKELLIEKNKNINSVIIRPRLEENITSKENENKNEKLAHDVNNQCDMRKKFPIGKKKIIREIEIIKSLLDEKKTSNDNENKNEKKANNKKENKNENKNEKLARNVSNQCHMRKELLIEKNKNINSVIIRPRLEENITSKENENKNEKLAHDVNNQCDMRKKFPIGKKKIIREIEIIKPLLDEKKTNNDNENKKEKKANNKNENKNENKSEKLVRDVNNQCHMRKKFPKENKEIIRETGIIKPLLGENKNETLNRVDIKKILLMDSIKEENKTSDNENQDKNEKEKKEKEEEKEEKRI